MEIEKLKKLSVSNLILIILNKENNDILRRCAEVELRKRIKNVGWKYDDFLHFDDKVIKERGFDIDNYLISPNVNMQNLMETYLMYDKDTDYRSNKLLFSEKHLCNELDFAQPFFRKVCNREIKNLDNRILNKEKIESKKEVLIKMKYILMERQQTAKKEIQAMKHNDFIDIFCANDAMTQLNGSVDICHEFLNNISDEEMYKLLKSKLGLIKLSTLNILNDTLFDLDLMQNICGLKFVIKDSMKLNKQKRKILSQVRSGFEVDYGSKEIQKLL